MDNPNRNSMAGPTLGAWEAPAQPEPVRTRHAAALVAITLDASAAMVTYGSGHPSAALLIIAVPAAVIAGGWLGDRAARRHYRRALAADVVDYDRAAQQACAVGTDDTADHTPTGPLATPNPFYVDPADGLAARRDVRDIRGTR